MNITFETEQEEDGRWIAEVPELASWPMAPPKWKRWQKPRLWHSYYWQNV